MRVKKEMLERVEGMFDGYIGGVMEEYGNNMDRRRLEI